MKIAVVDDERPARKELIHQILSAFPDSEIEEADSGQSALELLSDHSFDVVFLDVNLNDMEGIALAAAARKMIPNVQIVFATAYSQYAVKAFELDVDDYILKPFHPERVRLVMEKCWKNWKANREQNVSSDELEPSALKSNRLAVNINRTIVLLDIRDIVYIETAGRGCLIHTKTNDYTENQLLGEYEKKLAPYGFCRIHKSFLVNINYIAKLFPWTNNSMAVKMQGFEEQALPVGREKVKLLRKLIGI